MSSFPIKFLKVGIYLQKTGDFFPIISSINLQIELLTIGVSFFFQNLTKLELPAFEIPYGRTQHVAESKYFLQGLDSKTLPEPCQGCGKRTEQSYCN